jgi:predicted ABC-type transport system involved in lysophospholipase L1 biosynthesis ATPase subunit
MAVFHSLHDAGRTIVLVTHDASLAAHCGRIARLEDGRIVADQRVTRAAHAVREGA